MKITTIRVTPDSARADLGDELYEWLEAYHLPSTARDYWVSVAWVGKEPVGAHAFQISCGVLQSCSTYVLRHARKGGLALKLWRQSIRFSGAGRVHAVAVSRGGRALLKAAMAAHPRVRFTVR